jgi:hypothetical protein
MKWISKEGLLFWGCGHMILAVQQSRLFVTSPRHKAITQNLQLWALHFNPAACYQ